MRKTIIAAALSLAACLAAAPAAAQQGGNFGLGIQIGEPSAAIAGKLFLNKTNAVDAALAFSARHDWIWLEADYLWHFYGVIPVQSGELPLYAGVGAGVGIAGSPAVGAHGVVGLAYKLAAAPLDFFLDLSPGILIIPDMRPDIGVALGARFWF
jgi:hypothetical protein